MEVDVVFIERRTNKAYMIIFTDTEVMQLEHEAHIHTRSKLDIIRTAFQELFDRGFSYIFRNGGSNELEGKG